MTEPTDAELWQLYIAMNGSRQPLAYACAVLEKWGRPAQAAEPVAWLRNTTDPQPHAVTNLKYRSAVDAEAGVEYIPVFAAPQPVQAQADGFFLLLPQRPKPEAPAGTAGLDWDAYSGAQMLAYGRDCSNAAIVAARAPADSVLEDAARLERERICAVIKAEDDHCVEQGDYMLDSDDCIKIVRGEWVRPVFSVYAARNQGEKQ